MKVIGLFPVKNDAWILDVVIPHMQKFTDEILCLDGGSTDGTKEKLQSYGVMIKDQDPNNVNYSSWRQELLDWGRSRGGTHFVWLDADEAFTAHFLPVFRTTLEAMIPGETLMLQWLCLWKSPYVYRNDTSVWSNLYKDFIFCDDGVSNFGTTKLHESRTPGDSQHRKFTTITPDVGAVLHFQFVAFNRFQLKQAFQRCREYVLGNGSARRINYKYRETLDDPTAKTLPIPQAWIDGIAGLPSITDSETTWYTTETLKYFDNKGIEFFEPLEVWYIDRYKQMFIKKTGREPRTETYPSILIVLNTIRLKVRALLR
jgi:glycosyltransferase involved in cell wall biosynthesis